MKPALTVIPGGRGRPEVIEVERRAWDELRIARTVAAAERVTAADQERRLLLAALAALCRPEPDVATAENHLVAAIRIVTQEATRAAADIEPAPDPVPATIRVAA